MAPHRIAVIPGDGIGTEVVPEGRKVLEAVARVHGIDMEFTDFEFASAAY